MSGRFGGGDSALRSELLDPNKGAGRVAFNEAVNYPEGSVGDALKQLFDTASPYVVAAAHGAMGDDVTDDTAALAAAVAATPAGGTLLLRGKVGTKFLTTGFLVNRSDISIIGDMAPRSNGANTALEGGTIVRGTVLVDGDNILLARFGADHGIAYSDAHRAGGGGDGLVVHKQGNNGIRRNIHVHDCVGMTRKGDFNDMSAAFHAVLLEGLEGGGSTKVVGIGGWYGVVLKVSNWTFDGLTGRENDAVGVYVKSNDYAPVANVVGSNVLVIAGGSRAYRGLLVQASNAELSNVVIQGVTAIGGGNGGVVCIEGEVAQPAVGVEVAGITTRNTIGGALISGPVYASRIEGIVDKPTNGAGLRVTPNTAAAIPNDIVVAMRVNIDVAQAAANHISIESAGSRVFLERAHVTVGYGNPGKLLITANTKIGDVYGVLSSDRSEANLINGWSVFSAGQSCGVQTRGGVTQGYGRIKANGAGTTSDTFMQIGAGAAPQNGQFMATMMGYDGATGKPTPVFVSIDPAGNCAISPNRAAYAANVSYFDLTSLRFPAQLPVAGPF